MFVAVPTRGTFETFRLIIHAIGRAVITFWTAIAAIAGRKGVGARPAG